VFGQKEIEVRRPTITNCSRKCVPFVRTANEAAVKPLIAPFIGLSGSANNHDLWHRVHINNSVESAT